MKQYVAFEVRIYEFTAEEVIRTSSKDAWKDYFEDDWWSNITGGQGA